MKEEPLKQVEEILEYHFNDKQLLEKAFVHSSAVDSRKQSNERLEFLGDAILDMAICGKIFERFPDYLEGELTKIKSMLVSRTTCAKITNQLKLQKYLKLGKGMTLTRAISGSIAAGLLEAVIGAIYIDGGYAPVEEFILRNFNPLIEKASQKDIHGNYKSMLQQYAQKELGTTPLYELLDEKGPDHNKCFETAVFLNGHHYQSAWGVNKKQAEQKAAFNALAELGLVEQSQQEK